MRTIQIAVVAMVALLVGVASGSDVAAIQRLQVSARSLLVVDDVLFVGGDDRVRVYDISVADSPVLKDTLSVGYRVDSMVVTEDFLVVGLAAETATNVLIVDISDLTDLSTLSETRVGAANELLGGVGQSDGDVIVGVGAMLYALWADPDDAYALLELGTIDMGGQIEDVEVVGDVAYVAQLSQLATIDVAFRDTMVLLSQRSTLDINWDIAVSGGRLASAQNFEGIALYDIEADGSLVRSQTIPSPQFNDVVGVAFANGIAYGALRNNPGFANGGLRGFDEDTGDEVWRNAEKRDALAVALNGDVLYLAEDDSLAAFASEPPVIVLKKGWNFVSIPREPTDNSVASVFGELVIGPVWEWQNSRFVKASEVLPLRGYFCFRHDSEAATIDLAQLTYPADVDSDGDGTTDSQEAARDTAPDEYKIELAVGWNAVSLAALPTDPSPEGVFGQGIGPLVRVWGTGRYYEPSRMSPLAGHWVLNASDSPLPVTVEPAE
ncbi:MAG: hypothetical protein HN742_21265 [Lentisphaerae bacterium]|nr:hypothetical protein [Lentisphaerota bacterium]MBT4818606.1 hypothetical protein [Lentisphaerota bacterium]MBT5605696.1 hypothetical protein [Lentisphaerota bacterium]MBT7060514.1 hypothetical protein [Lentisphaerota bacterium]MBT7844421.1 hypothetical protein [Lentisphaerota bacterium]